MDFLYPQSFYNNKNAWLTPLRPFRRTTSRQPMINRFGYQPDFFDCDCHHCHRDVSRRNQDFPRELIRTVPRVDPKKQEFLQENLSKVDTIRKLNILSDSSDNDTDSETEHEDDGNIDCVMEYQNDHTENDVEYLDEKQILKECKTNCPSDVDSGIECQNEDLDEEFKNLESKKDNISETKCFSDVMKNTQDKKDFEDNYDLNCPVRNETNEESDIITKLNTIDSVWKKVCELGKKIDSQSINSNPKEYLYCEEMLTKCLLELDEIVADGNETIRNNRKSVVKSIDEYLMKLESVK